MTLIYHPPQRKATLSVSSRICSVLGVFILVGLFAGALTVRADETLAVLKVGSDTYSNVTVTAVTATDIYFTHANGMGNAKLKNLAPELQKHFHYDPKKAGAAELKQAQANAQYHDQLVHPPPRPPPANEPVARQPVTAHASDLVWSVDLPAALDRARAENKMVLLDFTGSDWCPWCIKFDHEVLSTDRFATYAQYALVLVKLDFPRQTPQPDSLKQANAALEKKFGVEGFPTYVLLNSDGRELGRQVGYLAGGPNPFIVELDAFSKR